MFNAYTFEKKLNYKKKFDKLKESFIHQQNHRKKMVDQLSKQYKKRIESFIQKMTEQPIKSEIPQKPKHSFRDDDTLEFQNNFRPKFVVPIQTQQKPTDYYMTYMNKTTPYEITENGKAWILRQRNHSKEIQKDMRFTDNTAYYRFQSKMKENNQKYLDNEYYKKLSNQSARNTSPDLIEMEFLNATPAEKKVIMQQQIARTVLPQLHRKTHFNAVVEFSNLLPLALTEDAIHSTKSISKPREFSNMSKILDGLQNQDQSVQDSNNKQKNNFPALKHQGSKIDEIFLPQQDLMNQKGNIEAFDPYDASSKILLDCNQIRQKNPLIKPLKRNYQHYSQIMKQKKNLEVTSIMQEISAIHQM